TFEDGFTDLGKRMSARMRENGTLSGRSFTDALEDVINHDKGRLANDLADIFGNTDGLDRYFDKFENVDTAVDSLRTDIGRLSDAGGVSNEEFLLMAGALDKYADRARVTEGENHRVRDSLADLRLELERGADNASRVEEAFRGVDGENKTLRKSFSDLRDMVDDVNVRLGSRSAFNDLAGRIGGSNNALNLFHDVLGRARSAGVLADREFFKMNDNLDVLAKRLDPIDDAFDKATKSSNGFAGGISTDAKQIIAIVAIIAGAAPQILSLGSFIASSVVVGVTALAALGAGIAVAVAGFIELSGSINDLPKAVQPAAKAFQGLLKPLQALQDAITVGLFSNLTSGFESLGTLITNLTGPIQQFSAQVGQAIGQIITAVTSPAFTNGFTAFLAAAGPIFSTLTQAAISFGGAIGNILVDALPYAQKFADGIAKIGDAFSDWTKSQAGRDAITKFFEHGQQIAGPLLNLVGKLGDMFGRLVTDQTVAATATFLDTVTQILPFIESLIGVLNQANVFQVVADILSQIGNALIPILNIISPILDVVLTLIEDAIRPLGAVLQLVALVLEPVKVGFEIFNAILQALQPYIISFQSVANDLFSALQTGADTVLSALKPAFDELLGSIINLLPSPQALHDIIVNQVVPAIQSATDWIVKHLIPAVVDIVKHVSEFIDSLGGFDGIEKKLEGAWNAFKTFGDIVSAALTPVKLTIDAIMAGIRFLNGTKINVGGIGANGSANPLLHAAGGILNEPTFLTPRDIAGEAGAEAIVPLQRPLSQISPEVRPLAAFAQGKTGGDTTVHNWEPGSVTVVTPAEDPEMVAETVVDNIIAGL
ncbi:MAG TPA: hypothetical protein VFQ54_05400, partial [Thermomicrobiales bacterium]|nr:hypothetical protein [Thermomicrobiales bacterium]